MGDVLRRLAVVVAVAGVFILCGCESSKPFASLKFFELQFITRNLQNLDPPKSEDSFG